MVRRSGSSVPSEVLSLRDMMNRMMENAFISPEQWWGGEGFGRPPAIDVTENQDAYVVKAELPGWKPEDIEITAEGNTITLRGQLSEEREQSDENTRWHHREMRRSSFQRTITLPTEVLADKAKADFENGVLTLTLPKSEEAKPKQIKIGAMSGSGSSSQQQIEGSARQSGGQQSRGQKNAANQ
jgi:HSP20 family protein